MINLVYSQLGLVVMSTIINSNVVGSYYLLECFGLVQHVHIISSNCISCLDVSYQDKVLDKKWVQ